MPFQSSLVNPFTIYASGIPLKSLWRESLVEMPNHSCAIWRKGEAVVLEPVSPPCEMTEHFAVWPRAPSLAHLELAYPFCKARFIRRVERVLEGDVEISLVPVIGPIRQSSVDDFTLPQGQDLLRIEHRLLPMRVLRMRSGREADRPVTYRELNVEPYNKRVDKVISPCRELEWVAECEIFDFAGIQIEYEHRRWISDDRLHLHGIHQRLGKGDFLERSVVETIDIIPVCNQWLA